MKFLVLNGPNLNMLGIREPEIYGRLTYEDLEVFIQQVCENLHIDVEIFQSNYEGALVGKIQQAYFDKVDGIIINPAAFTHTSVAILDALKAVSIPAVEIHISKVEEREDFRQISYPGKACFATVMGKGIDGYKEAILLLKNKLQEA